MNLASTVSTEVCVYLYVGDGCMLFYYNISLLVLLGSFCRFSEGMLFFFFFPVLLFSAFWKLIGGAIITKCQMPVMQRQIFHCSTVEVDFNEFGAQSVLGNAESSCREGNCETGVMRETFFSEVEQAEVMLRNPEKYYI